MSILEGSGRRTIEKILIVWMFWMFWMFWMYVQKLFSDHVLILFPDDVPKTFFKPCPDFKKGMSKFNMGCMFKNFSQTMP
jgi:hypothetical protein